MADRRTPEKRRKIAARRRSRDRHRNAGERFAVIEISASDLRLVMLDKTSEETSDRVSSAYLPWRIEAPSLNSQAGLAELSRALSKLSESHDLPGARVQVVLGGEFCVTKALRGPNDEVRSELQQLEQRSRLYLMLGTGEKVTVSSSQQIDARHQHAVAAVCNKNVLDIIHEAASNAGLQIESIEPSLVSTSRVIGRLQDAPSEPCLLVHIDQNTVELGICQGGQLLLDYRPVGHGDSEELVEVVKNHLSRLQRHVARQLREPPPTLRRIYFCGEKESVASVLPAFAACEQFDVEEISPRKILATWDFEKGAEDSALVPVLGLLLSTYLPSSERDAPDFMEHIVASRRTPLRPILVRSFLPLAAVFLIALSVYVVNYRQNVAVERLEQQVDGLAVAQARSRELNLKLRSMDAKLVHLKSLAERMLSLSAADPVAKVGHCMPSDVWLSSLSVDEMQSVKLSGVSYLEAGVFDFVRWLERSPGFSDVALRGTQAGQSASGPVINFDVELKLGDLSEFVKEVARNE